MIEFTEKGLAREAEFQRKIEYAKWVYCYVIIVILVLVNIVVTVVVATCRPYCCNMIMVLIMLFFQKIIILHFSCIENLRNFMSLMSQSLSISLHIIVKICASNPEFSKSNES